MRSTFRSSLCLNSIPCQCLLSTTHGRQARHPLLGLLREAEAALPALLQKQILMFAGHVTGLEERLQNSSKGFGPCFAFDALLIAQFAEHIFRVLLGHFHLNTGSTLSY